VLRLRALNVGSHRYLAQLLAARLHLLVPLEAMSVLRLRAGAAAGVWHLQFRRHLQHMMRRCVQETLHLHVQKNIGQSPSTLKALKKCTYTFIFINDTIFSIKK